VRSSLDRHWSRRHRDIKAAFNRSLAGIFKEEAFPVGALDLNEPRAADHWGFKAGVNTEIAGTLPADLLLKGRVKEGREPAKYLLDFTTKHPNPFADNQTALVAGTAARLAEEAKFRHYNKGRKRKGEGGKKERREKKEERENTLTFFFFVVLTWRFSDNKR